MIPLVLVLTAMAVDAPAPATQPYPVLVEKAGARASMSSATFFVSRVPDGWIVWHQAH